MAVPSWYTTYKNSAPDQHGNGSMLRPTAQPTRAAPRMDHTRAVAAEGRAAIDRRRAAVDPAVTQQGQALADLYGSQTKGDAYDQWAQAQGFGRDPYPVAFGRTDKGAYSGFKTEGELKAAIIGRGDLAREQQMMQADALKALMAERLDALGGQYTQKAAVPIGANIGAVAGVGLQGNRFGNTLGGNINIGWGQTTDEKAFNRSLAVADAQQQRGDQYLSQLDEWYAQQGEPLVAGMETAQQIKSTPDREYALRAGRDYGVDPNIVAGWHPMSSEIGDAAKMRDLQSLHDYGVPFSETQRALGDMQSEAVQNQKLDAADQQAAMESDILGATSYDAKALASQADVPVDEIWAIIQDPAYADAVSQVEQVLALPADNQKQIDDQEAAYEAIINSLRSDPALARVVSTQYNGTLG